MVQSKFFIDKQFEQESWAYLKESEIFYNDCMKLIAEVKQREFQKMGMDTVCLINGEVKTVDVKAMAGVLPTFSQELKNITSGNIGWLLNDELKTDYYLFVYHLIEGGTGNYSRDKALLTRENIKYTKAILIEKEKILEIIKESIGLNKEELRELTQSIETEFKETGETKFQYKDNHLIPYKKGQERCYFVVSKYIKEQPINCIVRRDALEENALKVFEIKE